ncbi:MAG: carboxypeptidase-like regulatory domain-containing protein, partial [Planctomycetota bacterium]
MILTALAKLKVAAVIALLALGSVFTVPLIVPGLFQEDVQEGSDAAMGSFVEEEANTEAGFQTLQAGRERIEPSGDGEGSSPALMEHNLIVGLLDQNTLQPVTAFDFKLLEQDDQSRWIVKDHRTVQDEEGKFSCYLDPEKPHKIEVRSSGHLPQFKELIFPYKEDGAETLQILMDPGRSFKGRVLDASTGRPIEGAMVTAPIYNTYAETIMDEPALENLWRGFDESFSHTTSDQEGYFNLQGLNHLTDLAVVIHDDYAQEVVTISDHGGMTANIFLERGARIYGTAADDLGKPAQDIMVYVAGKNDPLIQPVFTGEDGSFVTPPLHPGPVFLVANTCSKVTDPGMQFAREFLRLELGDRNQQVHFGPSPDKVTWFGTMYESEGNTCAFGTIHLWAEEIDPQLSYSDWMNCEVQCDEMGRFEIPKLPTGAYKVLVKVSDLNLEQWIDSSFHISGRIEKDIHLSLKAKRWFVMDSSSRKVIRGHGGTVLLMNPRTSTSIKSSRLKSDGSFSFDEVPAGIYDFKLYLKGSFVSIPVPGITIGHGKKIEENEIEIPPLGELEINVTGFQDIHDLELEISPFKNGLELSNPYPLDFSGTEEIKKQIYTITCGNWLLCFNHESLGTVDRWVEIPPHGKAFLTLDETEFSILESDIEAHGRILYADGSPVADAYFSAFGSATRSYTEEGKCLEGTTDSLGRFSLSGLNPGYLDLSVQISGGRKFTLPKIRIPADQGRIIPLDLQIPSGGVRGEFHSKFSGTLLKAVGKEMLLTLWRYGSAGEAVVQMTCEIPRFHLTGAPAGK